MPKLYDWIAELLLSGECFEMVILRNGGHHEECEDIASALEYGLPLLNSATIGQIRQPQRVN